MGGQKREREKRKKRAADTARNAAHEKKKDSQTERTFASFSSLPFCLAFLLSLYLKGHLGINRRYANRQRLKLLCHSTMEIAVAVHTVCGDEYRQLGASAARFAVVVFLFRNPVELIIKREARSQSLDLRVRKHASVNRASCFPYFESIQATAGACWRFNTHQHPAVC